MSAVTQQFIRQFETLKDKEALERERFHTEQAEAARLEAKATYDQALAQKVQLVQEAESITGRLSKVLLHYYGTKIDSEILGALRGGDEDDREQVESLFEVATKINRSKEPIPVLLDSPQTRAYFDGPPDHTRELWLVLVDPRRPFFADSEIKDGVLMHAFTGQTASVVVKSLGLLGLTYGASVDRDDSFDTQRLSRMEKCELIGSEARADGRSGSHFSEYAYSGRYNNLVMSEDEAPVYTVGWDALDELVAQAPTRHRRYKAARNLIVLADAGGVYPEIPVTREVLGE